MTPKQQRWFNRIEIGLWVLAAGALLYHLTPAAPPQPMREGSTAPSFSVHTLRGEEVDLASLRGRVVLVNFWATWCPPCRLEIPGFQSVYEDYKDRGFTVVGLSTDQGGESDVRAFIQQHGISYPIAMAPRAVMREYGGIDLLPQSFLIDRKGKVRKMVTGVFSEAVLRRSLDQLLPRGAP